MTGPTDRSRAEEIFLSSLEQPSSLRDAWLVDACGEDLVLLGHLRELLLSHEENDDGLLDAVTAEAFSEQVPTRIGFYNVSRLIGTGGMSAVFDAVHSATGARTAVKVIRIGLATARQRVRLQVESELLARLNHPGIARLYDAGQAQVQYADRSTAQRMYIAMEYVDGMNIARFCEQKTLGVQDRVRLMMGVARAVQHAHESGVIHRDIKPANILVTADRTAKVVDFGIARLAGSERHMTMTGVVMGTPSYMSPEQMAGRQAEVGTRSDVYSLGAVLYELMAGKPPIEAPSALTPSAAFAMMNAEPARLMTLRRDVPRDLDAIVHKALDRKPEKRYATARELSDDLDRWLNSRPVEARPPGAADRLRLQIRRRPKLMAGLFVGSLSLLTLGSLATFQAIRATRAEGVAIRERDEALKQSERADQQAKIAKAVASFLTDDVLAQANSLAQAEYGIELDPDIKISTALDRAASRLDTQFQDAPQVEAEIRFMLGMTYRGIGKSAEAAEQFKRASEIKNGFEADSHRMLESRMQYAVGISGLAREQEALDLLIPLHADCLRVFGEAHELTTVVLMNQAAQLLKLARFEEALPMLQKCVEMDTKLLGADHTETLSARGNLAYCLKKLGRTAEAAEQQEQIVATRKVVSGPGGASTVLAMNNLALSYHTLGQTDRAIAILTEALEAGRKAIGPDHPNTLVCLDNLAGLLSITGKDAEALELSRDGYARRKARLGMEHPDTLYTADSVVEQLIGVGQIEEAFALAQEIYPIEVKTLGEKDPTSLATSRSIVICLARLGRSEEALAAAQNAMRVHVEAAGVDDQATLLAADLLAQQWMTAGRFDEALPLAQDTLERARRVYSPKSGRLKTYAARLADCLDALNRSEEAEAIRATTRPSPATTTPATTSP